MLMGLLRSDKPTVNVIVSIIPPGVPCPITSPILWRIWAGFEVTPGIGRVLMVGIGGGSVLVCKATSSKNGEDNNEDHGESEPFSHDRNPTISSWEQRVSVN